MKNLLAILTITALTSCNVEQTATDFKVTVKPLAGQSVASSTDEDTPILISYEVDEDSEMPELSFNVVEAPTYGQLKNCKYTSKTSWECTYVPFLNFNGEDKIAFKTKNGDFQSDDKSYINLTVTPVPDAPIVHGNQSFTMTENQSHSFSVLEAKDPDTKTSQLTYKIVEQPKNGTLTNCFEKVGSVKCTYTPKADFVGDDNFTYSVADTETVSLADNKKSQAKVTIHVLREWIPVTGISSVKVEDKKSNALIVFALDTSGSMQPYLAHMKTSVANFIDDIASRGFKATLAFITSDQLSNTSWKDVYSKTQPHPDYPTYANSYIKTWERVPRDSAVKIFEIDAYDIDWNAGTSTEIETTKQEILTFIDELPEGSDDERLLCSTIRFLNSSYAENKNYVGVFSIANEDDAVSASSIEQAYKDCRKSKTTVKLPKPSCEASVVCSEGEEGCIANWIYTYTKVKENPYPAEFTGTCEKQVTNYSTKDQARRKGNRNTMTYKNVSTTTCNEEDKVIEAWRSGVRIDTVYKTETYTECRLEWETLDNPQGCRELTRQVENGTKEVSMDEFGTCATLSESWSSCNDYEKVVDDGCKTTTTKVENGYKQVWKDQTGTCDDLSDSEKALWVSCTDYNKTVTYADGTKTEQYTCTTTGGSTCDDHTDFFVADCSKTKEAGSNPPTLITGQKKSSTTKRTCLEVTGFDNCDSIVWDGKKSVTTTENCAMQAEATTYNYFSVDGATTQTLSNSVANKLKTGFTKAVFVDVSHHLALNKAAIKQAEDDSMNLPSESCSRYIERREKFTKVVDGLTKYLVDGVEFNKIVGLLSSDQASTHSICSPERYPSDKLDYLVEDAQLEFKVEEYATVDNLKITGVKIIYASGETKNLKTSEYTYSDGSLILVDPTLAKNLVEIQMNYSGYEK